MRRAKYIITSQGFPILFHECLDHGDFKDRHPESAGFCQIGVDAQGKLEISAYGESMTLNIKSRPEDAQIIRRLFVAPYDD